MKNNWKRTAAFIMSMMIAAGTVTASTGIIMGAPVISASAEEEAEPAEFKWTDLRTLIANAEEGETIALPCDIDADRSFTIESGTNVILDLCGHTVDMKGCSIRVNGIFAITDSSSDKTGTVKTSSGSVVNVNGGGTFNINGGNYYGANHDNAVFGFDGSSSVTRTLNFNDGIINTSGSNAFSLRNNTGDLNLNGGVVNCTTGSTDPYVSSCVLTGSGYKGKITLNGSELNTTNGSGIYNQGSNDVTIELIKGSITTGENGFAVYAKGETEVIVSGDPSMNTKMNIVSASFPELAPTYKAPGHIAYYVNSEGEMFSDKALTKAITEEETVIPQLAVTQQLISDGARMLLRIKVPREEGTSPDDYTASIDDRNTAIDWTDPDCGVIYITSAAKNMGDTRELSIMKGGSAIVEGQERSCSVSKYLYAVINSESYSAYHKAAMAMLRYGSAAQVYFGYNDRDLVNRWESGASLNTIADIPEADCRTFTAAELNSALGLGLSSYAGMNMNFTADNSFYMAFAVKAGADTAAAKEEIQAKLSSNSFAVSYTIENDGKYVIVKVADIPLLRLGETIFTAGDIEISAMQYIAKAEKLVENDKTLSDLCKSLYGLYTEAKKLPAAKN